MSSTHLISKRNEPLDLSPILEKLGGNVTRVMASLFDLQRATINKNGYDPCLAEIKQLRRSIRRDWENITAFLKQTNQFADDINYLRTIVATATMEELDQFKNDLIEASKELVIKCQALTSVKRDGVSPYDTFWSKGRRARSSSPYHRNSHGPSSVAQWKGTERNLNPDGYSACSAFRDGIRGVDSAVRAMSQFWRDCYRYLSGFGGKIILTKQDAVELTNKWPEYQEDIGRATTTINEACDAIMIEAKGTTSTKNTSSSELQDGGLLSSISVPALLLAGATWASKATLERWTGVKSEETTTTTTQRTPTSTQGERRPSSSEQRFTPNEHHSDDPYRDFHHTFGNF